MEIDFLNKKISKKEAININPLVLAYIGDAVYEVIIRNYLIQKNMNMNVHKLHVKATGYVKAKAQSEYMKVLLDELNEEEMAIFKRGRNSKSYTSPKHAEIGDYRIATGFEALIGYLYMVGENERINELLNLIIED